MKIQVSGAIASKNGVTLFTPTGDSKVYGQDSWRTGDLLKAVLIPLANSGGQPITVELDDFSLADRIKQITGGAVQAKETVENGVSKVALTVGGKTIEDTGTLNKQLQRALYEGSPGLGKFLERYAKVDHMDTAQEVLRFMEKLDLPLADDGCMVLYKFLDTAPGKPGYYVDHHTRKVMQRVGSRVYMDIKDYRKDRSQCATGLHVCSKDYGQYGNKILIVKVRPEDIVAVPHHEGGKMRVLAYHIVASLDDEVHALVANRKSALSAKNAQGIIAKVIAGQHTGIIEEVLVGAQGQHTVKVLDKEIVTAERNALRKVEEKVVAIDPKAVREAIDASKSGVIVGEQADMDGVPVFVREIDGRKALVAMRPKHGHGTWVSISRLTPIAKKVEDVVETVKPVKVSPPRFAERAPVESAGTEPWQLAKPGDTVRVEGSQKIADGDYVVDRVSNDGRSSRCRVKCEKFGSLGVQNTLIKAIVAQKPEAPSIEMKVEAAVNKAGEAIKTIADATFDKATIYANKLARATELHKAGKSLREIEKELRMCRKALSKHLKAA